MRSSGRRASDADWKRVPTRSERAAIASFYITEYSNDDMSIGYFVAVVLALMTP